MHFKMLKKFTVTLMLALATLNSFLNTVARAVTANFEGQYKFDGTVTISADRPLTLKNFFVNELFGKWRAKDLLLHMFNIVFLTKQFLKF